MPGGFHRGACCCKWWRILGNDWTTWKPGCYEDDDGDPIYTDPNTGEEIPLEDWPSCEKNIISSNGGCRTGTPSTLIIPGYFKIGIPLDMQVRHYRSSVDKTVISQFTLFYTEAETYRILDGKFWFTRSMASAVGATPNCNIPPNNMNCDAPNNWGDYGDGVSTILGSMNYFGWDSGTLSCEKWVHIMGAQGLTEGLLNYNLPNFDALEDMCNPYCWLAQNEAYHCIYDEDNNVLPVQYYCPFKSFEACASCYCPTVYDDFDFPDEDTWEHAWKCTYSNPATGKLYWDYDSPTYGKMIKTIYGSVSICADYTYDAGNDLSGPFMNSQFVNRDMYSPYHDDTCTVDFCHDDWVAAHGDCAKTSPQYGLPIWVCCSAEVSGNQVDV